MRHIEINELLDRDNNSAVETNNIAKILFGYNYVIGFGKFIFGYTKAQNGQRQGKIYDTAGRIIFDYNVSNFAPLIRLRTKKIVGYLIIDTDITYKSEKEEIEDHNDFIDVSYIIEGFITNKNISLPILLEDGTIDYGDLVSLAHDNLFESLSVSGLKFKGEVYQAVHDDDFILNYLICTRYIKGSIS